MNILIADDERISRLGLQKIIRDIMPDYHEIDMASDGEQAVSMLRDKQYDLIFMDINMPKVDGIEVMRTCIDLLRNSKWYILTGYAEFQYAKEAIRLGASEYILKPVSIDQIRDILSSTILEVHNRRRKNQEEFANAITSTFLQGNVLSIKEMNDLIGKGENYYLYVFFIEISGGVNHKIIREDFYNMIVKAIPEKDPRFERHAVFFLQTGELCLLMQGREGFNIDYYLKYTVAVREKDMKVWVFWTRAVTLSKVYSEMRIMMALMPIRIALTENTIFSLRELERMPHLLDIRYVAEKVDIITGFLLTENWGEVHLLLNELKQDNSFERAFTYVNTKTLSSYLTYVWKWNTHINSCEMFYQHLELLIGERQHTKKSPGEELIEVIKEYVKSNYMNDVSISVIAEHLDISPSYISRVFREKTGGKYIDYVTKIRMEAAQKLLLKRPDLTVKSVAEKVGYVSERYFSKTFYKYFHEMPSQYAKNIYFQQVISFDANKKEQT